MTVDEYVPMAPSEADARESYIIGMIRDGEGGDWDEYREEAGADWDAFLARVRRDAAREALDGLAATCRDVSTLGILHYRDTHYHEESP